MAVHHMSCQALNGLRGLMLVIVPFWQKDWKFWEILVLETKVSPKPAQPADHYRKADYFSFDKHYNHSPVS